MKKLIIVLCIAGGLVVLWVVARVTHTFETFVIATTANEPTYKAKDIIITSCLKKPDHGDFVVFKGPGGGALVFRCIAKGGDVLEIKNAKVYLNGKLLDEPYTYNDYYISNKQLTGIAGYVAEHKYPMRTFNDTSAIISMTEKDVKMYHLDLKRFSSKNGISNQDNLGPIKVPENFFFLMGDNRHDAMDSRHIGFISRDNILSTVIN